MKKRAAYSFLAVSALLFVLSGCASQGRGGNGVNAQMGVLADEVTRMDQALQETRAQLQQEQARISELEARTGGGHAGAQQADTAAAPAYAASTTEPYAGVYRTPSGFELPSTSVQKALKAAGFYNGDVDGKIGPGTREAVRNFQRANGLTPDGIIGKTTWNKLKVHLQPQGG